MLTVVRSGISPYNRSHTPVWWDNGILEVHSDKTWLYDYNTNTWTEVTPKP